MYKQLALVCVLLFGGCGTWQTQDQTATVGNNSKLSQDQVATAQGSSAKADRIDNVITENNNGLNPMWWLAIGMLLPMPKFMKLIF